MWVYLIQKSHSASTDAGQNFEALGMLADSISDL